MQNKQEHGIVFEALDVLSQALWSPDFLALSFS